MQTNYIMPHNFKDRIARIVKEIQTQICIDDADVEILEGLLKDELNGYYNLVDQYYDEEYCNAISSARNSAYDAGYAAGYDDGYDEGYSENYS